MVPQYEVVANGHVYRLDFRILPADAARALHELDAHRLEFSLLRVEVDGHEWHGRTQQQAAYRNRRDRGLVADGWRWYSTSGEARSSRDRIGAPPMVLRVVVPRPDGCARGADATEAAAAPATTGMSGDLCAIPLTGQNVSDRSLSDQRQPLHVLRGPAPSALNLLTFLGRAGCRGSISPVGACFLLKFADMRSPDTCTVLVIDDDSGVRDVLRDALGSFGYRVETAASGMDGLALFASHRHAAVVTDLAMPEWPGWHVIDRLRTMDPWLPIIIVTGCATPYDIDRASVERIALLEKPVSVERLAETIRLARGQMAR